MRIPAGSICRTDGEPNATAPVAAQWYDARPAFKPLPKSLPVGTDSIDMINSTSATGMFTGSGLAPGNACVRVLAQVRHLFPWANDLHHLLF